jgi:hypothetical protein
MSSHQSQVILTTGGSCVFLDASSFKSILCVHVWFVSHTDISLVVEHKENKQYRSSRLRLWRTEYWAKVWYVDEDTVRHDTQLLRKKQCMWYIVSNMWSITCSTGCHKVSYTTQFISFYLNCHKLQMFYTITRVTSSALTSSLRYMKLLTAYWGSSSNHTVFIICLWIYFYLKYNI